MKEISIKIVSATSFLIKIQDTCIAQQWKTKIGKTIINLVKRLKYFLHCFCKYYLLGS